MIRDQSMWAERSERGAERAKYSQSAERVFIQRPERSLCLAPVPLRYRSHHESRACTNPPRIHLCLQQLTKLSAYTSKIVRCEGEMEFVKYLYIIGYRLRGGRGAGLLRVDFPFRAYVNRLEQPHCLRNTRVSGAVQHNWSVFFPQQSRNKPAPRPHRRQCVPDVRHRLKTAGVNGMQMNFKCERAWIDFTEAGWNCRRAGSGIERSGLGRLWAVERGERTPTWAGSGNSHRSAPLTCSVRDAPILVSVSGPILSSCTRTC